jgi:hypothetical protein
VAANSSVIPATSRVALGWIALAFGLVFAALTLSGGYVSGRGTYWIAPGGDAAKGEIGWFYYARDAWRFPLLDIGNYHAPEGSSIVLSDSVPLVAVPAKAIYKIASDPSRTPPIYTGAWVALCLVLQAIAASRLLRALGIVDPVAHVAGIAIFCYAPILMVRFGHASLMAQCLVVYAIELYVRAKREPPSRALTISLCALPPLAMLVHPYLCAMCGVVVAATILDQWRGRRIALAGVLARFGAIVAATLVLMLVGGFLIATRDFGDYGLYSLNLLSPFVPFPTSTLGMLFHTEIPSIPDTWQWEGTAYLGAGVALLAIAAVPALAHWRINVRRHAVLLAFVVATLIFAVSNRIGFGAHEIAHIPLPDFAMHALSQFRGSGRFVWIVVYALVAAAIAALAARSSVRSLRIVLVVAALLQIADVVPMQRGVRAASEFGAAPTIDRDAWTRLIGAHERVFQFPSYECGGMFGQDVPGTKARAIEIDWIAATLGVPDNSAYLARTTKDCDRERADAVANVGEAGTLRIYRSTEDIGAYLAQHGADFGACGTLDDTVVCSAGGDLRALH